MMSEPTVDRDPFEVLAESFLARFRAGERPSIEDLAARHPDPTRPEPCKSPLICGALDDSPPPGRRMDNERRSGHALEGDSSR